MDWTKVVKSLDDTWDAHRQLAQFAKDQKTHDKHDQIASMAAMLRDAFSAGLPR